MKDRTFERQLSISISRLFRDSFGKGPESLYVTIGSTFLTIYLRNFITPTEHILLTQGMETIVRQTRQVLMNSLLPEIKVLIKIVTKIDIQEFYYDWGLHNGSGVIIGMSSLPFEQGSEVQEEFYGKIVFDREIRLLSQQMGKIPESTYSGLLNARQLLVIRKGILVNTEKELIRIGFHKPLKIAKRTVEARFLNNVLRWEQILNKKVVEIFKDWDFERDKSVFLFVIDDKE